MKVSSVSVSRRMDLIDFEEGLVISQRAAARRHEIDIFRQFHRQIIIRHRDYFGAVVHHRNRSAPIALPADQPIAQAVVDRFLAFAPVSSSQSMTRLIAGFFRPFAQVALAAIHRIRIHHHAGTIVGLRSSCRLAAAARHHSGWITTRTGRSWARANSKSRWSCAGTAMIAPVP